MRKILRILAVSLLILLPASSFAGERFDGKWLTTLTCHAKGNTDGYTWKCVVYCLVHLPLGIFSFTLTLTGLALSLGLVAAPVAHWIWHVPLVVAFDQEYLMPLWVQLLLPLGGLMGLAGTLHLALGLGRLHGGIARALLVRR